MNIFSLIGIGVVAALIGLLLRESRPEFSLLLSIGTGVFILGAVLLSVSPVLDELEHILSMTSLSAGRFSVLIKSLGICCVASLACDTCREAGQLAVAGKLELAAKAAVLFLALPLFRELLEQILAMINLSA